MSRFLISLEKSFYCFSRHNESSTPGSSSSSTQIIITTVSAAKEEEAADVVMEDQGIPEQITPDS